MNLPKPLIPSNVDLQDYTYMPLHVLRLRDSEFTSEVSAEAFRAGVLLWCTAWHQVPAGSLPNNDKTLSNMAGYGRVVKEWEKIKDEALHGWVLCDDNRWYHPVVCEVALESWLSKQEYNFKKFADRLRKRNVGLKEKHLPLVDIPLIEQWISAGMPSDWGNNSLAIPNEHSDSSSGTNKTSAGIPTENALKEKKENIRESNINNISSSLGEEVEKNFEDLSFDSMPEQYRDLALVEYPDLKTTTLTGIWQRFAKYYRDKPQVIKNNQGWQELWLDSLNRYAQSEIDKAAAPKAQPAKQIDSQPQRTTDTTKTKERKFEDYHDSQVYSGVFTAGQIRQNMQAGETPESCMLRLTKQWLAAAHQAKAGAV